MKQAQIRPLQVSIKGAIYKNVQFTLLCPENPDFRSNETQASLCGDVADYPKQRLLGVSDVEKVGWRGKKPALLREHISSEGQRVSGE